MNKNEIYLMKSSKVIVPDGLSETSLNIISTIQKNFESLGYILSFKVITKLQSISKEQTHIWYQLTVETLRKMLGTHVNYEPMYPNFPRQVMEMEEAELYWNAMFHYLSAWMSDVTNKEYIYLPYYDKETREPLKDKRKLKVIDHGSEEDFHSIFTKLCARNASLSQIDKDILKWFVGYYSYNELKLPDTIPQKETIAILAAKNPAFNNLLKTATDVLRMIVVMCDGDVSLAESTKFRRLQRYDRRIILNRLNTINEITEDMLRYKEVWKRVAKELHPWDYKKQYPNICEAFDVICNDLPFETYNSKLEGYLKRKQLLMSIELLKQRPGIFARRLDQLLRLDDYKVINIPNAFLEVADQVSTPVLLQAWHHFQYRNKQRVFFPKGNTAKMQIPEENLDPLDTSVLAESIRGVLINRFKKLSPIYNPYLDEKLKTQIVSFAARSSSKNLYTLTKGSRLSFGEGNIIRFFLWWKNINDERVDIDLSAIFFDTSFTRMGNVYYRDLRSMGATHSGDITNAPNGACEFIDCEIDKLISRDIRFIIMSVNSFTQQLFTDIPECFAGWMLRNNSGEIFEPKTVENKLDLTSKSKIAIPVIIDILNREIIWTDLALTNSRWANDIRNNKDNIRNLLKVMVDLNRPNLYDLLSMHIEARGIFTHEKDITTFSSFDDMSEYLCG